MLESDRLVGRGGRFDGKSTIFGSHIVVVRNGIGIGCEVELVRLGTCGNSGSEVAVDEALASDNGAYRHVDDLRLERRIVERLLSIGGSQSDFTLRDVCGESLATDEIVTAVGTRERVDDIDNLGIVSGILVGSLSGSSESDIIARDETDERTCGYRHLNIAIVDLVCNGRATDSECERRDGELLGLVGEVVVACSTWLDSHDCRVVTDVAVVGERELVLGSVESLTIDSNLEGRLLVVAVVWDARCENLDCVRSDLLLLDLPVLRRGGGQDVVGIVERENLGGVVANVDLLVACDGGINNIGYLDTLNEAGLDLTDGEGRTLLETIVDELGVGPCECHLTLSDGERELYVGEGVVATGDVGDLSLGGIDTGVDIVDVGDGVLGGWDHGVVGETERYERLELVTIVSIVERLELAIDVGRVDDLARDGELAIDDMDVVVGGERAILWSVVEGVVDLTDLSYGCEVGEGERLAADDVVNIDALVLESRTVVDLRGVGGGEGYLPWRDVDGEGVVISKDVVAACITGESVGDGDPYPISCILGGCYGRCGHGEEIRSLDAFESAHVDCYVGIAVVDLVAEGRAAYREGCRRDGEGELTIRNDVVAIGRIGNLDLGSADIDVILEGDDVLGCRDDEIANLEFNHRLDLETRVDIGILVEGSRDVACVEALRSNDELASVDSHIVVGELGSCIGMESEGVVDLADLGYGCEVIIGKALAGDERSAYDIDLLLEERSTIVDLSGISRLESDVDGFDDE